MRYRPSLSVRAPRRVPTMVTFADWIGAAPTESTTVPRTVPVPWAGRGDDPATDAMRPMAIPIARTRVGREIMTGLLTLGIDERSERGTFADRSRGGCYV